MEVFPNLNALNYVRRPAVLIRDLAYYSGLESTSTKKGDKGNPVGCPRLLSALPLTFECLYS